MTATRATTNGRGAGGEVVHYIARHGQSRVAKAVLISSMPQTTRPRACHSPEPTSIRRPGR